MYERVSDDKFVYDNENFFDKLDNVMDLFIISSQQSLIKFVREEMEFNSQILQIPKSATMCN